MARILIADDDAAVRDLASRALTTDGHQVSTVADGAEALDHMRANGAPEVIVSDVDMPNVDGIKLAREAAASTPGIAIVLMSGYVEQLNRAQDIKARKVVTIRKPFSLEDVRRAVRDAIGS